MKKKYSLFIAIMICFLVYVGLSWFIPTAGLRAGGIESTGVKPVGLFGLFYYPGLTAWAFLYHGMYVLAIGGLYGVMNKTGVYSKLVDKYAAYFKGREKFILTLLILKLVILSSFSGLTMPLFIVVPFLMGVILKAGFNKITAVASTVGAILLGNVAGTFSSNVAYMNRAFDFAITDGIISKIVLLALVSFLFVVFVSRNKETKFKKEKKTKSNKAKKEEVKEETLVIPFAETPETSKKSEMPLKILFILLIVIVLVVMFDWHAVFGIRFFNDLHARLLSLTVLDFPIIANFLGFVNPIGKWEMYDLIGLLLLGSVVIAWVYSLKCSDLIDGFITGTKRIAKTAFLVVLANIVFLMVLHAENTNILLFITDKLGSISDLFAGFWVIIASFTSVITGFFINYLPSAFDYLIPSLRIHYDMGNHAAIMGFLVQGAHGLALMILPTSVVLIGGLSLLDVSFKEWIKYIWKYVLLVFVMIVIIGLVLMLL